MMPEDQPPNVAPGVQSATFWVDESGAKKTAADCYVVAAVKTRKPDELQRALTAAREAHGHNNDEIKFSRIKQSNAKLCRAVIDVLEESDARLVATVVHGRTYNPFNGEKPAWEVHADVIAELIAGSVNRNEIATVLMDVVTTPPGMAVGPMVKRGVNGRFRATSVVTAVSLNSKSSDCLQAADLVAGAIFHSRTAARPASSEVTEKLRVVRHLAAAFGVPDLTEDVRLPRFTVMTLKPPPNSRTGAPPKRSARR